MIKNANVFQKTKIRLCIQSLFVAFILVQPILDYYFMFDEGLKEYTLISISTIIRILFILIAFFWTLYSANKYRKSWILWCAYFIVLFIYSLVHLYLGLFFPSVLPTSFQFVLSEEVFYLIRLVLPILLLYITFKQELSIDQVRRISITLLYIICLTMVVTNVLKFALIAYSEVPKFNQYTFFSWFSKELVDYRELTSKGLFYKGNQISGVLVLLFPINLMFFLKKPTLTAFFGVILAIISMFMLGSKVGIYGMALSFVGIFLINTIIVIFKKNTFKRFSLQAYACFIILFLLIYPASPTQLRAKTDALAFLEHGNETLSNVVNRNTESVTDKGSKIGTGSSGTITIPTEEQKFQNKVLSLQNSLSKVYMPYVFFKIYPVKDDYYFWESLVNMPYNAYNDSRKLEELITERIYSNLKENQWKYDLFGMSRSIFTTSTVLLEKDFIVQKYTIGKFGLLLFFLPYFVALLWVCYRIIKKYFELFSLENLSIIFSIFLFFGVSVFSGHLIDEVFPIFICVFYLGYLLFSNSKQNVSIIPLDNVPVDYVNHVKKHV